MVFSKIIEAIENIFISHGFERGALIVTFCLSIYLMYQIIETQKETAQELRANRVLFTENIKLLMILFNSSNSFNNKDSKTGEDLYDKALKLAEEIENKYNKNDKKNGGENLNANEK